MREKKIWLVVTFHTTAAAIAMEKLCAAHSLAGRLIPVPRVLTADCGMAWRAETGDRAAVDTLNIADIGSGEVADALSEDYGIATRSGAHCAPRLHRALGTVEQGAVRFSFGWYNTVEEVDTAIRAVAELAR